MLWVCCCCTNCCALFLRKNWADTQSSQAMLQGKDKEAYYATHDYSRRLICVDLPEPAVTTQLCPDSGDSGVLVDGVVDLCAMETKVLKDLRGLQSLGGPDFLDTPWCVVVPALVSKVCCSNVTFYYLGIPNLCKVTKPTTTQSIDGRLKLRRLRSCNSLYIVQSRRHCLASSNFGSLLLDPLLALLSLGCRLLHFQCHLVHANSLFAVVSSHRVRQQAVLPVAPPEILLLVRLVGC